MQIIKCPNDDEYFDLHTLSGYPYGTSLIVTSNSANETANGVFHSFWEERADDAFPDAVIN